MQDSVDFLRGLDALTSGKSLRQILLEARAIIEDPDRWCQGAVARNSRRQKVMAHDPTAVQWCLSGAIAYVSNAYGVTPPGILQYLDSFLIFGVVESREIDFKKAEEFNDTYTHNRVLAYLDTVIERTP